MKSALPFLVISTLALAAEIRTEDEQSWHRLVSILQYLESDYPAAAESRSPTELEEQRAFAEEAVSTARELGTRASTFLPRLEAIRERVDRAADPAGVSGDCAALVEDVAQRVGLIRSPRHTPDLKKGAQLYQVGCAACHGADGKAQVEIATTMQPPPLNLMDPQRMQPLSPYRVFNELTFGISGTAMPSYSALDETDRWSLAFFTFALGKPPCDHQPPPASLEQLAVSSDPQLAATFGEREVPCLRQKLPTTDENQSLVIARSGIEQSLSLWRQGRIGPARRALLDAYLKGIEPIEPTLRMRNGALLRQLEQAFQRMRAAIASNSPQTGARGSELLSVIERVRQVPTTVPDFWSVFWLALLVIIREGFEASVVIAALLAALHKMGQRHQQRVVHAGWILAVALGILAFIFGRHLLNGANRELLEGVVALVAVALLVYAALWLNARANVRRFMGKLRDRMESAAGAGGALGLFTVAFTAMLRESFETALFIQGLSIDSPSGAAWGAAAGAAALVGLVVFVNRVGYRLPMKPLFNASTVLLLVTAVILLGKGIHELQIVGILPMQLIGTFQIEPLGIYAEVYSLLAQAALAAAPLLWLTLRRRTPPQTTMRAGEGPRAFEPSGNSK